MLSLIVVGGGLAGSEAAWQAAQRGIDVTLYEMRPATMTPAHVTDRLAELVCSNSLGSQLVDRASGLLKEELRQLGSVVVACADETAVPAGGALAVDRDRFAQLVTERVANHPRIAVVREEVHQVPDGPAVVATGPLTSPALAEDIARLTGQEYLYFYDAMAPIVTRESVNEDVAYLASRYEHGEAAYLNCPLTEPQYDRFVAELVRAEQAPLRDFEREDKKFFEACLPVEEIAHRGRDALRFGPLKPLGLPDPRTGGIPFAVVQLRQDNAAATLYNLVGFQTNLKWGEQARVFRLIPGLERAEFVRYGVMHRNTFVNAPTLLHPTMQFRTRADLFFGGQITGTEGYIESTASGCLAGINAARHLLGQPLVELPETTMIGALCRYVATAEPKRFQPMKANFGLFPPLGQRMRKRQRYAAYSRRALAALTECIQGHHLNVPAVRFSRSDF